MNLKPRTYDSKSSHPAFLRDHKFLEWTVGNITLDTSKLAADDVVEAGTAVFRNEETGLFELVAAETAATMAAPVLTAYDVVVAETTVNESVPAIRKASVYEELLTGVTDNFKAATQGRITYDI